MKTKEEYIESLRKLKPRVYLYGREVGSVPDEPALRPGVNSVGSTYDYAWSSEPKVKALFRAKSAITGNETNVFNHMPQNKDDLYQWLEMMRFEGREVGCIMRCVGSDLLRTMFVTTYEIDKKYGTEYHKRLRDYLKYIEDEDLTVTAAMTDVWGDRSRQPHQQADPDLCLRVVGNRSDGVVIRGVKAPVTTSPFSHEILVTPTRAMTPEDKDWTVVCGVPANAEGVKIVVKPSSRPDDPDAPITSKYAPAENVIVFDDVFVPWERVFMCGESEFAARVVELFTTFHRFACGTACKPGMADVLIGAALNIAEYSGLDPMRIGHFREKLTNLIMMAEDMWACGITAAHQSTLLEPGVCYPDPVFSNMGKLHCALHTYDEYRITMDFAGGIAWALPDHESLEHPDIKNYVDKYFRGRADVPTENRIKMLRLIYDLIPGIMGARTAALALHGGGSEEAMRIMLQRAYDTEDRKKLARRLAGITE